MKPRAPAAGPEPEFSRLFVADKIHSGETEKHIAANEKERRNLAARFGLLGLDRLEADLKLRLVHAGRGIEVSGRMAADFVQQCVVTLEPLPAHLDQDIMTVYAPGTDDGGDEAPESDIVEPLEGGVIDLGELMAQYLGSSLDPYPRKPGAAFVGNEYGAGAQIVNPFSRLGDFGKKPENDA